MGFRFFRRMKIGSGLSVNMSKSGPSLSFGPRGAKITVGSHGIRQTAGIPGTGLYYTKEQGWGSHRGSKNAAHTENTVSTDKSLTLGFFKRLITPENEKNLIEGLKAMFEHDESRAIELFLTSMELADAAFMAGFLSLKHDHPRQAVEAFLAAETNERSLGKYFEKYGLFIRLNLPITTEITAQIMPSHRGTLLGLVEAYQQLGKYKQAIQILNPLWRKNPDDIMVMISLVELLLEYKPDDPDTKRLHFQQIVEMTANIENKTPVHTALLLYKSKALHELGLNTVARDTLTKSLRQKNGRDEKLLRAIRYDRAVIYDEMGNHSRAREEFEKIYAKYPNFKDVSRRLGIK